MRRLVILLFACLLAAPALAWGEKGHLIVNEAAARSLPNDLPPFFHAADSELVYLGPEPDRWRGNSESLEAVSTPDHFLDYEYVAALELPRDRYAFIDLEYSSGTLRRFGVQPSTIGFLPWRIAELSEQLTVEWRLWRRAQAGSPDRRAIEKEIVYLAGILGHYAGDASNPQHATWNYNGWVDPNPNGYATDCDAHTRFERDFISHAIALEDVTPRVAAPLLRSDYFAAAVAFVRASNGQAEPLYRLDRDGAFDLFRRPPSPAGVAFASDRLAAGASLLRDLWWSTWRNSAAPAK